MPTALNTIISSVSNSRPSCTPPSSPTSEPTVTLTVKQFVDAVKEGLAAQGVTASIATLSSAETVKHEPTDSEATTDTQPKDLKTRASKLEVKVVNEIWNKDLGAYKLVESLLEPDRVDELDQYVIVVRIRTDRKTEEPTSYIDVKSEGLRDILRDILQNIRGVSLREDKPAIEQNYLYHYLPELEAYYAKASKSRLDDPPCLKHLCFLIEHIKKTYAPATQRLTPLLRNGEISYDLLWGLFKPNTTVYTTCFGTGKPRCVKYDMGEERGKPNKRFYTLECRYLDFDGEVFGEASIQLQVPQFRGIKRIGTLNAFPLDYHPDKDKARAKLIACGQKFSSLVCTHHCHCKGDAFLMHKGKPLKVSVNSRVMIDAAFFRKMNPNYSRPSIDKSTNYQDDPFIAWLGSLQDEAHPDKVKGNDMNPAGMKENDLLICCPTVPGFSFGDKLWAEFAVADITEIQWSSAPYDCLTISKEQKATIMALAMTHMGKVVSVPFDDFVAGKGRGLNMLLHGPPGVGKTLTAEAVSEHLRKPLYSISAGELNVNAAQLEIELSRIFQTASHWDALLLLDEADVYLERRSLQDLQRNSLVSVFLRKLEYFEGILFLTTNRVSHFDEAILSRIHLMFKYDVLNKLERRQIWERFIQKARTFQGPARITEKDIARLASIQLNGRQIKNVVAIAHALATIKETQVCSSHILQAIRSNEKFLHELTGAEHVNAMFN